MRKKDWKTSITGAQFMQIEARMQSSGLPFVKADVHGVAWPHSRGGLVYFMLS
ncbi:MAG TPA: hypothetical protein PKK43_06795 [Spirochaetota bacterium]|nr:hypothetical protein [Spirochaetota bacterium]